MNAPATIPTDTLPALIDKARASLASARTSAEVLEARDVARVIYDAAKSAAKMSKAKRAHDDVIAAVYRLQADALLIESRAKVRLADEYDAAQDRGEVAGHGRSKVEVANVTTAADLGLRRDEIHEARQIRDAERAEPGLIERALTAMVRPEPTRDNPAPKPTEPTRAALRQSVLAAVADAKKRPDRRNPDQEKDPFRDKVLSFIDHCEQLAGMVDVPRIACYRDPLFPTTTARLRRNLVAAINVLQRAKEAIDVEGNT